MQALRHNTLRYTPWFLFVAVLVIPLALWLELYNWQPVFTPLALFPLLGVWAWSIMWTHHILGALTVRYPDKLKTNHIYGSVSGWLVLLLILLHPGLLAYEQKNSLGLLPPESFNAYAAPSMELFITLGFIGLVLFLSYEIFDRLRHSKLLRAHWIWISLSQLLAMLLIFIHGINLGQSVLSGYGGVYWVMLGVTLVPALYIVVRNDWKEQQQYRIDRMQAEDKSRNS